MSFATLEEAWGVRSLVQPPDAPDAPPPPRARKPRHRPFSRMAQPQAVAKDYAPAPAGEMDADAQATRRVLAMAYEKYGPQGVARLLPPGAMLDIAGAARGHGGKRSGWRRWLARVMKKPETLLLALLCVFALFVAWDMSAGRSTAAAVPSLASLHMTPFGMGGSV